MTQPRLASVAIHPSQFPDAVRRDLLDSLRSRRINHKFHYDSYKQTAKWLRLHQEFSPSRTDPDCASIYDRGFQAVASRFSHSPVHLVGLGCGGGQKDTRLLRALVSLGRQPAYTPADVSVAMVLVARQAALAVVPESACFPLVCDLASTADLAATLDSQPPSSWPRIITFFGMIPNFESSAVLGLLTEALRPGDALLFSANLAPGPDYLAGVKQVLPLYDNALTRDWLLTFLLDLGVEVADGNLRFVIEPDPRSPELKRIAAWFCFHRARQLQVEDESFEFKAGDEVRLFFSTRHTPALVRSLLAAHSLRVDEEWIAQSGEEGVFLVTRTAD